jgi:hypothetical protein
MNRLHLQTHTGHLLDHRGDLISALRAKRGTSWDLEILPDRALDDTTPAWISAKLTYTGILLAHGMWAPSDEIPGAWRFSTSLRGADLAALFTPRTPAVTLLSEATFIIDGKTRKSQTLTLSVERDIFAGDEIEPGDLENTRRTGEGGYQEYSFDGGTTWWRYAPVIVEGIPEWQWTGPLS